MKSRVRFYFAQNHEKSESLTRQNKKTCEELTVESVTKEKTSSIRTERNLSSRRCHARNYRLLVCLFRMSLQYFFLFSLLCRRQNAVHIMLDGIVFLKVFLIGWIFETAIFHSDPPLYPQCPAHRLSPLHWHAGQSDWYSCRSFAVRRSLLLFVYPYIINNKGGLIVNGIYVLPGSRKEMGDLW